MKIIETERLILRVPTYDDFGKLYSVHANPEANIFNPGWKKPSIEEYRKTLDKNIPSRKTAESLGLKYDKKFDNVGGERNVYYFK